MREIYKVYCERIGVRMRWSSIFFFKLAFKKGEKRMHTNRYTTKEAIEKRNEDINKIVETLRVMGHATASEISELTGINRNTIKCLFTSHIKPKYPDNAFSIPRKGYEWVEVKNPPEIKAAESKAEPTDKYGPNKNSEGYSDPTASKAIRNVEKSERINSFKEVHLEQPGEIWEYENGYYNATSRVDTMLLVLTSAGNSVCGLDVRLVDERYNKEYCAPINLKGKMYYVDCRRIFSKPVKSLDCRKAWLAEEAFKEIKTQIATCLGLEPVVVEKTVEVPVEKVVEKTVEVPVEKIVEKTVEVPVMVDRDDPAVPRLKEQLAMAEQRAEIWEKAYYLMATGKEKG